MTEALDTVDEVDAGGKKNCRASSVGHTIGDVLYDFLLGTPSEHGFWSRFVAMTLGGVLLHSIMFATTLATIDLNGFAVLTSLVLPLTAIYLVAVNITVYVIICCADPSRGHLVRYFSLGVLLSGGTYFLATRIVELQQ